MADTKYERLHERVQAILDEYGGSNPNHLTCGCMTCLMWRKIADVLAVRED